MIDAIGPVRLKDGKARLYLPAGCQTMTPRIVEKLTWEPDASRWLIGGMRRGSCFVDVGAHVGYYSVLASKAVCYEGKIHAFEPDPLNFDLLQRNIALNGLKNVQAHNAAVSNHCGRETLFKSGKNTGDHRIVADGERTTIGVDCVKLDTVLAGQQIDTIKIDTQGAECHVLEGARKLMAKPHPMRVLIELWPYGLKQMGRSAAELLGMLVDYGFRIKANETAALFEQLTVENRKHTNLLLERSA